MNDELAISFTDDTNTALWMEPIVKDKTDCCDAEYKKISRESSKGKKYFMCKCAKCGKFTNQKDAILHMTTARGK